MKRLVFVFTFVFVFLSLGPVRASEFDTFYDKYLTTFNNYYKANQEYIIARSKYLTYKTLNSKNEAFDKTKKLMVARDEVLVSYFETLNRRLETTGGVTRTEVDLEKNLNKQIIAYVADHEKKISGLAFLEDIIEHSGILESRSLEFEKRARKTASLVLIGRGNILYGELLDLDKLLKKRINELKGKGKDVSLLERWMLEFSSKKENAQSKLEKAKQIFITLAKASDVEEVREVYTEGQTALLASRQYVREAIMFANELVNELKRGKYFD